MTTKTFETTVEYNEDFDEYYITIPDEIIDSLSWDEGTVVEWQTNKDGSILLSKVDEDFYEGEEDEWKEIKLHNCW